MTWTGQTFTVSQILTAAQMNNLQADITAVANGDAGAPSIIQAALGSSSVGQGQLKSALQQQTGSVGATSTVTMALTGGAYTLQVGFVPAQYLTGYGGGGYDWGIGMYNSSGGSLTYYMQATYIQASPPYDLGYGDIPLFMFAVVDRNGQILNLDLAQDAPWHYNGPTNVKADMYEKDRSFKYIKPIEIELSRVGKTVMQLSDLERRICLDRLREEEPELIELTQDIKNADIDIVPHPFLGNDLSDKSVALLHPCCDECLDLIALRAQGERIDIDFANKYLKVDNSALSVRSPKGVLTVDFKWKNTK